MFIDSLFVVINFLIFVLIIIYLVKKKFAKAINDQIEARESIIDQLAVQKKELVQKKENIELASAQEQEFMNNLKKNIVLWNDHYKQTLAIRTMQANQRARVLEQKIERQMEMHESQKLQKKVVQEAMQQALYVLQQRMQHAYEQQKYLEEMFNKMY